MSTSATSNDEATQESTSSNTAGIARPYYLLGPCPVWCDGFHEEAARDDGRLHMSIDLMAEVILSTEDPAPVGPPPHTLAGCFPLQIAVCLEQHVREAVPRVVIDGIPAGRTRLHLLPAEAREIGAALLRLARLGEGDDLKG